MPKTEKDPVRIPAASVGAHSRWNLPEVSSAHLVALQRKKPPEPEPPPEPIVEVIEEELAHEQITVAELEQIRETAEQEGFAQGKEEGHKEGYQEGIESGQKSGFEQGYQEGLDAGKAEMDRAVAAMDEMLRQLDQPLQHISDALQPIMLEMVLKISKAVVGSQLRVEKELIEETISTALAHLPSSSDPIKMTVSPSMVNYVQQLACVKEQNCTVISGDNLQDGDCLVQTTHSLIEYRVDQRFDEVVQQLTQQLEGLDGHDLST